MQGRSPLPTIVDTLAWVCMFCNCTSVKVLSVTETVLLCIGRRDSACAYWQEKGFSGHNAYSVSKLANLMFSNELAPLMKQQGVTVNCVHPGIIATNVLHDVTEVVRTPRYSLPLLPVLRACWRTCLHIYHVSGGCCSCLP